MNKKLFNELYQEKQIDELKQYYLQKYNKEHIENRLKLLNEWLKSVNNKIDGHWRELEFSQSFSLENEKLDLTEEIAFYKDLLKLKGE